MNDVPEQVGSYRLLHRLGEGGMGTVWFGEHTLLGRRAAVKLLHSTYSARPDIVTRFFNEARAATAISDPGIVQVFDFGYAADGRAYLIMELLEGETLDRRLQRLQRLPVHDAELVRGAQRVRDADRQRHGCDFIELAFALQPLLERLALEQLHDDVVARLVLPEVRDLDDVRVPDPADEARLVDEALHRLLVRRQLVADDFDRSAAAHQRVLRVIDLPHRAAPELSDDAVVADESSEHLDRRNLSRSSAASSYFSMIAEV